MDQDEKQRNYAFVKRPLTRDERLALGLYELRRRKSVDTPMGFN